MLTCPATDLQASEPQKAKQKQQLGVRYAYTPTICGCLHASEVLIEAPMVLYILLFAWNVNHVHLL